MIVADRLEKSFGSLRAVEALSLEIRRGEVFGLLGPNGAGKSTTISMLVGLLAPDRGTVLVAGDAPVRAGVRSKIGVAPQSLSLYGELTARENLEFFGRLYGLTGTRLKDRVDWALQLAALTDRANSRVQTFSGGMKRRLNIAAAMVHDPQVLLLDEPTVGVDPQSRNHIFGCIEELNRGGLTVLYTTHYMEEAERLCHRVAVMDRGRLLALDTVDGLIRQFGGSSLLTGEIASLPDGYSLAGTTGDGQWRMESSDPLADLGRLFADGVAFRSVQIRRPDLESVFLHLTGRTLRD